MSKKPSKSSTSKDARKVAADTISVAVPQAGTISEPRLDLEPFMVQIVGELDRESPSESLVYVDRLQKNLPHERIVYLFIAALRCKYTSIRCAAADRLRRLGPDAHPALDYLCKALASDPSPEVRYRVAWALGAIRTAHPQGTAALEHASQKDTKPRVRRRARKSLDASRHLRPAVGPLTLSDDSGIVAPLEPDAFRQTGAAPSEVLDPRLFGQLAAALRDVASPPSAEDVEERLDAILSVTRLVRGLVLPAFQTALDLAAGRSFGSPASNVAITRKINAVRMSLAVELRLRESLHPVYIRCARGPRSKHGTIQAVSADGARIKEYAGSTFPSLEAFRDG